MPTWWRNTMSSAKARRRSSLTMALPPSLITMVVPAKGWIHGSASISVPALSWAASAETWLAEGVSRGCRAIDIRSSRVWPVLLHVVVREVIGPDGCLGVAGLKVDVDEHFTGFQVNKVTVLADAAVAADLHTVHGHVELIRLEHSIGGAHGGEHPSPVGGLAEDGSFEEGGACNGAANDLGVAFACCIEGTYGDVVACTFGVADELTGQLGADLRDGLAQLLR